MSNDCKKDKIDKLILPITPDNIENHSESLKVENIGLEDSKTEHTNSDSSKSESPKSESVKLENNKPVKSKRGKYFKPDEVGEDITVVIAEGKYKQMLKLYDKFIKDREYRKMHQRKKTKETEE